MTVAGPVVTELMGLAMVHGPYAACETSVTSWNPVVKLKNKESPTVKVWPEAQVVYVSAADGMFQPKASATTCLVCATVDCNWRDATTITTNTNTNFEAAIFFLCLNLRSPTFFW